MNKTLLTAFCLSGALAFCHSSFAASGMDKQIPSVDSTGPTNPAPPTLPTPGTGIDNGTGTGIDGPDSAPAPGTDGTGREEKSDSGPNPSQADPSGKQNASDKGG